jgi:hypothetical protein
LFESIKEKTYTCIKMVDAPGKLKTNFNDDGTIFQVHITMWIYDDNLIIRQELFLFLSLRDNQLISLDKN